MAEQNKEWHKVKDAQGTCMICDKNNYAVCALTSTFSPTKGYIYDKDWGKEAIAYREHIANLFLSAPRLYEAGKNALVSLKLWANKHPDDEVLAMVITQLEYALARADGKGGDKDNG